MKKLLEFIKLSIAELKKVSWPDKEEVKSSTYVVLVTVIIISVFLGLVDKGISEIIKMVLK
ncbi:MAG: preprotein translocase subunit SecE [Spirochaetes bacterium]|nr:preprotein translocase subunit SecE [Spirochaetota bacterium]